jgi:hypothetical protein
VTTFKIELHLAIRLTILQPIARLKLPVGSPQLIAADEDMKRLY